MYFFGCHGDVTTDKGMGEGSEWGTVGGGWVMNRSEV